MLVFLFYLCESGRVNKYLLRHLICRITSKLPRAGVESAAFNTFCNLSEGHNSQIVCATKNMKSVQVKNVCGAFLGLINVLGYGIVKLHV